MFFVIIFVTVFPWGVYLLQLDIEKQQILEVINIIFNAILLKILLQLMDIVLFVFLNEASHIFVIYITAAEGLVVFHIVLNDVLPLSKLYKLNELQSIAPECSDLLKIA